MCINKQQTLEIRGSLRNIDDCLVPIIKALNDGGVNTTACCCGHGNRWGNIVLSDGRELIIAPDWESSRAFDIIHGRQIHDERRALQKVELADTTANNESVTIATSFGNSGSAVSGCPLGDNNYGNGFA